MRKLRPKIRGDSTERILELVSRLEQYALAVSPEAIRRYSCHYKAPSSGCGKFWHCDIHPVELKDRSLSEIEPQGLEALKAVRCLRPLIAENAEIFRAALASGELSVGDFFGAVENNRRRESPAARLLADQRCPYYGCVVPELAQLVELDQDDPYQSCCPFSRKRDRKTQKTERNRYRLLACELTRERFREFHRCAGVATISPVAIVPGSHDDLAEVVYLGREPSASYQYLALDPGDFRSEIPQAQARLHAARLVRHSRLASGEEPSARDFGGRRRTFESLAAFSDESDRSPLERSLGIRYIPAGEFLFMCLMWLWTSERPEGGRRYWRAQREGYIENVNDVQQAGGRPLLLELTNGGFARDLERILGDLEFREGNVVRRSSRLSDLVLLGLVGKTGVGPLVLTPRAVALTKWLSKAHELLRSGALESSSRRSPLSGTRIRKLLPLPLSSELGSVVQVRERGVREMMRGITSRSVAGWMKGLRSVLKFFDATQEREQYREYLRDEGFPVYPLVHLTLLLGFAQPLDWLALPLGGIVGTGAGLPAFVPQAGAFILATAREPAGVERLVNSLRPILSASVLVESSSLVEDVIKAKASVMEFGAVVLARQHEIKSLPSELAAYADPHGREVRLQAISADAQERRILSGQLGRTLSAAQLLRCDMEFIEAMRLNHWQFQVERLEDVQEEVIRRAWQLLTPLEEATGRHLKFLSGPLARTVWAPRAAVFHLAIEAIRNILRHDKIQDGSCGNGEIVVKVTDSPEDRLAIEFWNSFSQISPEHLAAFDSLKSAPRRPDAAINGDTALLLLSDLAECDCSKANGPHPIHRKEVGVLKLSFFTRSRS